MEKEKKMSALQKRLPYLLVVLLVMALSFRGVYQYFGYMMTTIREESVDHLSEIYDQLNKIIKIRIESNWQYLYAGERQLKETDKKDAYMERLKQRMGYTEFYFVDHEGCYITNKGAEGRLNIGAELEQLIDEKKEIASSIQKEEKTYLFLAIPAELAVYKDFTYEAIGVGYDNEDFIELLEDSAFDEQAIHFLTQTDGEIIVNNSDYPLKNVLEILEQLSDLNEEELEKIETDFKEQRTNAWYLKLHKSAYYFVYLPVNIGNWMLTGIVPAAVVNGNARELQANMFAVLTVMAIFISIALSIILSHYITRMSRRRLEEKDSELEYKEQLFSVLCRNVDDVFIMIDGENFHVDYVSPNAERLLGIAVKDILNDIYVTKKLVDHKKETNILQLLPDLTENEQREIEREYVHQKSGEVRFFHSISMCREIGGKKKYILVLSDRTNDRRLNQELSDAVIVARRASMAKSTFLSNMSHDIRTPMNAIIGFTTLALSNMENKEKVRDYLKKTLDSSNHLLGLIDDILDMSRIENGKMYLEESAGNLLDIFTDAKNMINETAKEKGVSLCTRYEVIHTDVYCDKVRLKQVLINLLSNAVKFTPQGGSITLQLKQLNPYREDEGTYEIRVKDTGIGMTQEFAEKIFEPFERERSSTVSRIQGTGLGMAITKNIVDKMKGTIQVETKQGKGTEFTIRLTFRIRNEIGELEQKEKYLLSKPDRLEEKRILLVEDNELNREIATELLEEIGMKVISVENGKLAVEYMTNCKEKEVDLILMDIQMPVLDGYEATKQIRQLTEHWKRNIPIIAMTANVFEEDKKRAIYAGMNGHLSKPIVVEKLMELLS